MTVDALKVAVPVGTVAGVQLALVLKSPEPGLASQVAFCAAAGNVAAASADAATSAACNVAARFGHFRRRESEHRCPRGPSPARKMFARFRKARHSGHGLLPVSAS